MMDKIQKYFSYYLYDDQRILKGVLAGFRGKVLDVGCGDKRLKEFLPPDNEYVGIDLSGQADYQLDISCDKFPFKDGEFDYCICNAVLEHVEEPEFVVKEINRVLKPGGRVWFSSPFMQPYHPDPKDFRRYSLYGLKQLVEKCGFKVFDTPQTHGTFVAIEYFLLIATNELRKNKKIRLNPLFWLYGILIFVAYIYARLMNLLFFEAQQQEKHISPGSKLLCEKIRNKI